MISTFVSIPYEIARLPLALVDSQFSDKFPETSTHGSRSTRPSARPTGSPGA